MMEGPREAARLATGFGPATRWQPALHGRDRRLPGDPTATILPDEPPYPFAEV